jgi:hypothetical protein
MKYMMMFWVDESAEATPDEDAAVLIAAGHPLARTAKVEVRPYWDAPWDH